MNRRKRILAFRKRRVVKKIAEQRTCAAEFHISDGVILETDFVYETLDLGNLVEGGVNRSERLLLLGRESKVHRTVERMHDGDPARHDGNFAQNVPKR